MIGVLCTIWGFNWVIMKLGNGAFPPVLFAAYRFLVGGLVLLLIAYYKKVLIPNKRDFKWFVVCGFLQTTYFNIAIQISLNWISAGLTSVLTYSMPFYLSLMAHFFIPGEKLTTRKTVGIVIGIVGLFIAMDVHLGGAFWALILALTSGISWALSNVIIKRKLQHCNNIQFTTWQMVIGAVGLLLYSLFFEHGASHWNMLPIFYVLFAGVVASSLAFVLWYHILSNTEASKASISLLLVPVIGILSGVLVLHETLKLMTAIGIVCVLAGIWIVNSKSGKPAVTASVNSSY
ncbi:DMT family transporter [Fodinisporobacter ferrooxydans]|uniref:DMT family transporter n=1 Tax=Fodinisporobacter ferrooxydans TaxID=2901836 RepID=A0ABY4CQY9_9BACL|nr:DMT family transporter [Alicyclobacillaceae bacterium MYW30-H2]